MCHIDLYPSYSFRRPNSTTRIAFYSPSPVVTGRSRTRVQRGHSCVRLYSLRFENTPQKKKHSASQILSYKIFSFCEQTLEMGANDASGQGLQSALKNRHQNIFLRKLQVFEVNVALFSVKITRQF